MTGKVAAALCGFLGVLLALVLWHLWEDHRLVDAIRQNSIQQLERMQQQQQPPPRVP